MILQIFVNGIMTGMTITLIALGLSLVFGILHIINLAHGEIYMLGGFGIWWFSAECGINYVLAAAITVTLVAFLGILIERLLLKPFRGNLASGLIVSVGLMLILQTSALLVFGIADKAVPTPSVLEGTVSPFGISLPIARLSIIVIAGLLVLVLHLFIKYAKYGQAMRAVAQDEEAAALQGININLICSLAMGIGCGLAAAAGCLMGFLFYVQPFMGAMLLMKALAAIVLGGMGSIPGTIVGGLIIGLVDSFGSTLLNTIIASMLVFLVMIVVLLVRPTGLFGHAE